MLSGDKKNSTYSSHISISNKKLKKERFSNKKKNEIYT